MKVTEILIEGQDLGARLISPSVFPDSRGYFKVVYNDDDFVNSVGDVRWVQENESVSRRGVLRGLHFQQGQWSQAKLVRVTQGAILDVIVDLRGESPTFGRYAEVELSAENHNLLYVPRGFAHGFVVLSESAQLQYKVDNKYMPQSEVTLRYDDERLGIDWRIADDELIISDKDRHGISLADVSPFTPDQLKCSTQV